MSVSSRERFCWTHEARPSPTRGFWLGNSPPGKSSPQAYGVTHRLCFKKAALLKNLASEPAKGKQLEPGTSLYPVNCPVLFTVRVFLTWIFLEFIQIKLTTTKKKLENMESM